MSKKKKPILTILFIIIIITITTILSIYFKKLDDYNKATFKLNGEETVTLEIGKEYKEPGYIAIVNKEDKKQEVNITSNLNTNELGEYEIKYTLDFDLIKKQKELIRKITIIDSTAPVLTINSNQTINKQVGDKFTNPTYKAVDNVDGNITKNVKVTSNVNMNKAGKYTIKYSVTDSNNNKTTKTITINVKEKPKPVQYILPTNEKSNYKGTFIEISINKQILRYYEKDKLIIKSNIVTGKDNATPTGNYKVLSKAKNVTLKGEDYESYVYYWIAFIGRQYGIHDATWRSKFGGTIYKYDGSHGCINMPYYNAQKLYELVKIGTPVYIHK